MALPNTLGGQDQSIQQSLFGDEPALPAADASAFCGCHVHRIRPPVKAHGGKYYLAPKIVPILLSVRANVTEYLEPCAFGASVFLAMPRMKREMLGDINPDVVALWTVLGAAAFLDIADYHVDPEREMRVAIEDVLAQHREET